MWLYLFSTFGFLRDRFLSFDQDDDLVGVIVYVKGLGRPQSLKVKSPTPWLDCRYHIRRTSPHMASYNGGKGGRVTG
nr:hypothetical protein CFP56_15514 [Quercus suber]